MKNLWYDDDAEVEKMTGVNQSTGDIVPYSYDDPDWRGCVAATALAILGAVYVIG
jgi:hypothetical protein